MTLSERINAFVLLGEQIKQIVQETGNEGTKSYLCQIARHQNGWFDEDNVARALEGLSFYLDKKLFTDWVAAYQLPEVRKTPEKKIGVVMAGNIPLVGIHDLLCVLVSGHILLAKLSAQDTVLMKAIVKMLLDIAPQFADKIQFVDMLKEADAFIATGSDNSARYFQYYFSKKPNIVRHNRVSIGVMRGDETQDSLKKLTDDILSYYGLGCRNVSKVYLPVGADIQHLLKASEEMAQKARENHKYSNNYDYNKSIYLVNGVPHLDNGGLLAKQTQEIVSPISVIYYEYYTDLNDLAIKLQFLYNKIQCIVSEDGWYEGSVPFGKAQLPTLNDYADGVDTMLFLKEI
jgi:hypothetical protein